MSYKILVTSTSFQDTPGSHHELLQGQPWKIDYMRGPLKEDELLPIIDQYDGVICGDDAYTLKVLNQGKKGKLKHISKYGTGLDSIDLDTAATLGISVVNCKGVNDNAVAEHVLAHLFCFYRNIIDQNENVQQGKWSRITGHEIFDKTIGIVGLGFVGKKLAQKAHALGMKVMSFDIHKDESYLMENSFITFVDDLDQIFSKAHVISLHLPLNTSTKHIISSNVLQNKIHQYPVIVNTSRGGLVDSKAIVKAINDQKINAYLTDVLENEPISEDEILRNKKNVIITPHVGSRTFENVQKQGTMAIENLKYLFDGIDKNK